MLEPAFETFGGSNPSGGIEFRIGEGQIGSRFWYVSKEENHLLQFQPDRFLMNWRRRRSEDRYPRFEGIVKEFQECLQLLEGHFRSKFDCELAINQAEVAYINLIEVNNFSEISDWLSVWNRASSNVESLDAVFVEVARRSSGDPYARLIHHIQTVLTRDGNHAALKLSLTFRGKPDGNNVRNAIEFLKDGRQRIVLRFKDITLEKAHQKWGLQS